MNSSPQMIIPSAKSPAYKPSLIMSSKKRYRTLENAATIDYEFTIGGLFSEAWRFTRGFKLNFFLGFLLYSAISYAVMLLVMFIFGIFFFVTLLGVGFQFHNISALEGQLAHNPVFIGAIVMLYIVYLLVMMLLNIPMVTLMMGLFVMSQKHLNGLKVLIVNDLFAPFKVFWKLLLVQILVSVFYILGFMLFILPGLYVLIGASLSVLLLFAYPNSSALDVLKASFKIVNKHFFRILGMFLLLLLINIAAMIPLGIGLIWSLPFSYLCFALLVQKVIEVPEERLGTIAHI